MALSDNAAYILLLQQTPPGFQRWMALEATDAIGKAWRAMAQSFNAYGYAILDQLRSELGGRSMIARLTDWEAIQGTAQQRLATNGTLDQRRAQAIARRRESGLPTRAHIQASLQALLGYAPTILEHTRAALTAANTRLFQGLPVTIPASGSVEVDVFVPDNALCSQMGAQLLVTITHPQVQDILVSLIAPDGMLATWTSLGTGAVTAQRYMLFAPMMAGRPAGGLWRAFLYDGGGNAGTWVAGSGDGIFVEGIGRNAIGADGYGSRIFEWSSVINESLVAATSYDRGAVVETAIRWNASHEDGGVALVQTDGTLGALCDDSNCLADLCVASS